MPCCCEEVQATAAPSAHVKDEVLDPEKLSKALMGLRLEAEGPKAQLGPGAGIKCVIALGYLRLLRANTYPAQVAVVQVSEQLVPMAYAKN